MAFHSTPVLARTWCVTCLFVGCRAALPMDELTNLDDTLALVQQSMKARRRQSLGGAFLSPSSAATSTFVPFLGDSDCAAHPAMCLPPFNCHQTSHTALTQWSQEGWGKGGQPNWSIWCLDSRYEPYASKCAAGDLDGAGLVQYQLTTAGHYGEHIAELDASSCFMDGHCANTAVTNSTTAAEAIQMCDDRFGREVWTSYGKENSRPEDKIGFALEEIPSYSDGFTHPEQTRPFILAACAMGNYHCDIRYCQNYCQDEYYVRKYAYLEKKFAQAK
mmetsp:Transcript_1170/g.1299  ORF Transcript_1170/g.1299 Transcript_1170/m.1299 type:complete len:275 (-) Transcript_1170:1-825(-)